MIKKINRVEKMAFALLLGCFFSLVVEGKNQGPYIELPKSGLDPGELAVLYLHGDKQSETIARYYQAQRNIPADNVMAIVLNPNKTVVSPGTFAVQKKILDLKLDDSIQALVLTWAKPYRVGCMSISAAFAFGFDSAYCSSTCVKTKSSAYFHSGSKAPYRDFNFRPTMMLAASNLDDAFDLINRGVEADDTQPMGSVFLLKTSDASRTVREQFFAEIDSMFGKLFDVQIMNQNSIKNRSDILFYFTGLKSVPHLDTLNFLPGAMADHLTSTGGQLTDSYQMSALRWLEAGATGSYGSAIEPCNFVQKFPHPLIAMWHYASGSTLLEAYWKSVRMPGQGNFIGEPLAAPFRGYRLVRKKDRIEIYSPVLRRGYYRVIDEQVKFNQWSKSSYMGGLNSTSTQAISKYKSYLVIKPPYSNRYRIEKIPSR